MKKILIVLLLCLSTNNASALSVYKYLESGHVANSNITVVNKESNSTKNIAMAAVGLSIMAIIIGVRASENNPGQFQIVRF